MVMQTMTRNQLIVMGERQHGKTYLTEVYAVTEAFQGKTVLFEAFSGDYAVHCFRTCEEIAERLNFETSQIRRTNGKWSIEFPSGGWIKFLSGHALSKYPDPVDLHVTDEGGEASPLAARTIRTVTL